MLNNSMVIKTVAQQRRVSYDQNQNEARNSLIANLIFIGQIKTYYKSKPKITRSTKFSVRSKKVFCVHM